MGVGALVGEFEGKNVGGIEGLALGASERVGDNVGDTDEVGPLVG